MRARSLPPRTRRLKITLRVDRRSRALVSSPPVDKNSPLHTLASQSPDRPVGDRDQLIRRALILSILSIVINALAGGAAVVVGLTSSSLSLLGFGVDAAIDSAASVALVWRFTIEARQPHRAERVETVAEGAVGVVLLVLAAYLAISAVRALATGAHPQETSIGLALLVFSLVVLPPLALAKYRTAARLPSRALRADSVLTGIAALLALISLLGLGLSEAFGVTWADAVGALIVAAIVAREGMIAIQAVRKGHPI
jgi:divalent metal cation (Fe/Co/Zn/Cd) transporter